MSKLESSKDCSLLKQISNNLEQIFKNSGKKNKEIAKILGVSESHVRNLRNNRAYPHIKTIELICERFHVGYEDIVEPPPPPDPAIGVDRSEMTDMKKSFALLNELRREHGLPVTEKEKSGEPVYKLDQEHSFSPFLSQNHLIHLSKLISF